MNANAKPNILVLGGGFAGLEAAFLLHMNLGQRAHITLVSDQERFLFKPNTIYIPFGMDPEELYIPLDKPTAKQGIEFVHAQAQAINPVKMVVETSKRNLPYDYLVVATGARMRPEEIPGLSEHAQTIFTPAEMLKLRAGLLRVLEAAKQGKHQQVLFLVPPFNKCSGPLYELVFMVETWLRRNKVRDKVAMVYSTFEQGYIQAFGPRLNDLVEQEFAGRGVTGHKQHVAQRVEADHVEYANGAALPYDLLVSFPPYVAGMNFPGLPSDDRGFVSVELGSRQVTAHPNIYVPGDAGDFPVKQAFLAFLQADAVASHITADVLGTKPELDFEPVSMCVMEQFDKATFAQVPLRLTGDPAFPVEVPRSAYDLYKVGSSPMWRMGKKLLGVYLPWRFGAGKPFHAGVPWAAMDMGLKVMSSIMAK